MNKLILVALKFAPVHRVHMLGYRDAFLRRFGQTKVSWIVAEEYTALLPPEDRVVSVGSGNRYSVVADAERVMSSLASKLLVVKDAVNVLRQARAVTRLQANELFCESRRDDLVHVLVQSTHPANVLLMKNVRELFPRASIRYYLHEPTSWLNKCRGGDGALTSMAVYLTQFLDLVHSDMFYVSHRRALESATSAYPIAGLRDRGRIMPLPFQDMCSSFSRTGLDNVSSRQVLMLGRADDRRCADVFLGAAAESSRRKLAWKFVMLSGRARAIPQWARALPNLCLRTGSPYSDEEMVSEVSRSRVVFNLYRIAYSQSGVTPVALMCGVPVIAHAHEHDPELETAGCMYFQQIPTATQLVDRLESAHGMDRVALRRFYERTFDASAIRIP